MNEETPRTENGGDSYTKWNWSDPRWARRVDTTSLLALAIEALVRSIELRDALAEAGGGVNLSRALFLEQVLQRLLVLSVHETAKAQNINIDDKVVIKIPQLVDELKELGILQSEHYRFAS